ncbi:precorrin-6y C5,15-methyltransferase (decarboxylating) subunit CbiE [Actinomadura sp. CNU-125]|uniref:precorrin-6y C5,15-methyltransferase (decarboxylating) subunit CbiE n=1 Tax=Actinomadura sp. CNU-125 TaxID=1904961 RepID=UPI000B28742E|nr:precorrin-6y C5,15-methyltransferase (decarboxylating) subunit CbiE [Actinomadura sp. CNU-125]
MSDVENSGAPIVPPDGRGGGGVGPAPATAEDVVGGGHRIAVVGIGAVGTGWARRPGRAPVRGGPGRGGRQLGMLPDFAAECVAVAWPSPMLPALPALFEEHRGRRVVVVASGDPMFFGVGTTLVRLLGAKNVRVLPHVSSMSLACARLGWSLEDTDVVSAVGRPLAALNRLLAPGRRVLVLRRTPARPGRSPTC